MLYLLDTANVETIERLVAVYPVAGVTTNQSILSREGAGAGGVAQADFAPPLAEGAHAACAGDGARERTDGARGAGAL